MAVVLTDELHQLILLVLVEGEAATAVYDPPGCIPVAAEDQSAVLSAFIVEEQQPGIGARMRAKDTRFS